VSSITSLFQSPKWSFVEELASPLLKSPEWNFAQEVAANSLNQNVKLVSAGRLATPVGKRAYDPDKVLAGRDFKHAFAFKLLAPRKELVVGNIFEVYYKKADLPTPYHVINGRLVALVQIVKTNTMKGRSVDRFEGLQKREQQVQANENDHFNKQMINDISGWNTTMQLKLITIFLSCVALGAMIPILVIKITLVALTAFTAMRLLQLYTLQKQNSKIIHVGHWVAQLWQAFSLDPTLKHRYRQYYGNIFFSEPPVLKIKSVETQIEDDRTAEKKEAQSLGITHYYHFRDEFAKFAGPFIEMKCETAEEQHQWVTEFLKENPFNPEIFKGNPSFLPGLAEERWKKVATFRLHFQKLKQKYGELSHYLHRLKQYPEKALEKYGELKSEMKETAKTVVKSMELDSVAAERCQGQLLQTFEEEYFSKVVGLGNKLDGIFKSITAENIGSLAFPQARELFEQAYREFIQEKPSKLDPVSLQKMIPSFQQELQVISQNYSQHVIRKAKTRFTGPS